MTTWNYGTWEGDFDVWKKDTQSWEERFGEENQADELKLKQEKEYMEILQHKLRELSEEMALTLGRIDRTAGVIDHLSKKCNPWERRIKIGELVAFNSIARPVVCPSTPDYPSLNYRFDAAEALAKAEQSNEYHECGESMTPKTLHRVKRTRGQAKSASKKEEKRERRKRRALAKTVTKRMSANRVRKSRQGM